MRNTFMITILCSCLLAGFSSMAQPGWRWGVRNTGRGGMTSRPSATDASGNLYVAGSIYGSAFGIDSMVFGSHTVYNTVSSYNQMIVTKVDTGGNYLWAIGSQGSHVNATALATDPSGDVFLVGSYTGASVILGSVTLTNSSSYPMFFIEKISSTGTVLWAKNIVESQGGAAPGDFGVSTDGVGNAYVTGSFFQYMVLMGSSLLTNHDASGFTSDIMLLKYNAAGTLKWARSFGGNHSDYPFIQGGYAGFDYLNAIMKVTPAGHIYLTGRFYSDSIKIGATTLYNPAGGTTAPGPTYSYLCKWDSSGNALWAKYVDRKMQVNEITANSREEVYVGGILDSATTWGSFSLSPGALMAKLDSTGTLTWAHTYVGGDVKTIGLDDSGNVFAAGNMDDSMVFGSTVLHAPTVHMVPMFAARFDSAGNYMSSVSIANGGHVSNSIRPDNMGAYYLVGNYFGIPFTLGPSYLDTAGILSTTTFIGRYKYATCAATAGTITGPSSVCPGNSISLSDATTGGTWTASNGNATVAGSGMVTGATAGTVSILYTVTSACGTAVASKTITVNPIPPAPVITGTGLVLSAGAGYTSYQWVRNSTSIPGATSATYTATTNGNYFVIVFNANGCINFSAPYAITGLGVTNNRIAGDIQIFPNPANNMLSIKGDDKIETVQITDMLGKNILSVTGNHELLQLDISAIPAGVYIIRVNNSIVSRFVKE